MTITPEQAAAIARLATDALLDGMREGQPRYRPVDGCERCTGSPNMGACTTHQWLGAAVSREEENEMEEKRMRRANERRTDPEVPNPFAGESAPSAWQEGWQACQEAAAERALKPGLIQARDTEWDDGVEYAKKFIYHAIRALVPPTQPGEGTHG